MEDLLPDCYLAHLSGWLGRKRIHRTPPRGERNPREWCSPTFVSPQDISMEKEESVTHSPRLPEQRLKQPRGTLSGPSLSCGYMRRVRFELFPSHGDRENKEEAQNGRNGDEKGRKGNEGSWGVCSPNFPKHSKGGRGNGTSHPTAAVSSALPLHKHSPVPTSGLILLLREQIAASLKRLIFNRTNSKLKCFLGFNPPSSAHSAEQCLQ
ncbi:hypothetical protein B296_00016347 [Ensete ventricosum]|uniref:Uncharacterized protein n=1 Tax=Ensete ventricosum TaxID=4639 RepID=A0A426Z8P4_ENSVE|nr:hypothetical protein B296_00016347 [Ensete ventricosum]